MTFEFMFNSLCTIPYRFYYRACLCGTNEDNHRSWYLSTIYQLVSYKNISDYMFYDKILKTLTTCFIDDKKK